ncbi:MAG: hypothetical protein ACOVNL_01170 [Prochlorococcaceae cyanobacterium]|jgi:hypothetical protein
MSLVVVFCRRWINWSAEQKRERWESASDFQRDFRVVEMHEHWQRSNPRISLYRYRERLQQLACRSWEAIGARLIMQVLPADASHDVPLAPDLVMQLRQANWLIPIDDDDWLAPGLAASLPGLDRFCYWMATWPSQLVYVHPERFQCATPFSLLPETEEHACPILVSSSYALSCRLVQHLSDQELSLALMQHGEASRWRMLTPNGLQLKLQACNAIHLRHQATAGFTNLGALDRRLNDFAGNPSGEPLVEWAHGMLKELNDIHLAMKRESDHY